MGPGPVIPTFDLVEEIGVVKDKLKLTIQQKKALASQEVIAKEIETALNQFEKNLEIAKLIPVTLPGVTTQIPVTIPNIALLMSAMNTFALGKPDEIVVRGKLTSQERQILKEFKTVFNNLKKRIGAERAAHLTPLAIA